MPPAFRILILSLAMTVTCAGISTAGDLTLRFQYEGELPQPKAIQVDKDPKFCGQQSLIDESLLVHPEDRGIKNVVVYVYTGRGGSEIAKAPPVGRTHTLMYKGCRFEPHILVMQAGDTLNLKNMDPVGHNANVAVIRNPPSGLLIPSGRDRSMTLALSEPAPLPVVCNIHPWMQGYVVVLDHPLVGVSDEHGKVVIQNLPEKELVFRVFVEAAKGSLDTVRVNGEERDWSRNRFTHTIQAGSNDLGTVALTANKFTRP